jgi:predicted transposase/invertase (TIGR01784 family)
MKRDDSLWKGILENVFDDFLLFIFKNAANILDLEKGFQFLDKELAQLFPAPENEHPKFVDKLVKVHTKKGSDEWILVHVEVQGYSDADFALRMYTYFYRIFDRYKKPVTAVAIFTGTHKTFHPNTFEYDFLGTSNTFRFNTYKIGDQNETVLNTDPNPFAIVVLTVLLALKERQLSDKDLLDLKLNLVRNLHKRQIAKEKQRALINFLRFYVNFADAAFNTKFDQTTLSITENKETMGIEEMLIERFINRGRQEGREEGREEGLQEGSEKTSTKFVRTLLATGKFTVAEIANFASVSEEFVLQVKDKMMSGE